MALKTCEIFLLIALTITLSNGFVPDFLFKRHPQFRRDISYSDVEGSGDEVEISGSGSGFGSENVTISKPDIKDNFPVTQTTTSKPTSMPHPSIEPIFESTSDMEIYISGSGIEEKDVGRDIDISTSKEFVSQDQSTVIDGADKASTSSGLADQGRDKGSTSPNGVQGKTTKLSFGSTTNSEVFTSTMKPHASDTRTEVVLSINSKYFWIIVAVGGVVLLGAIVLSVALYKRKHTNEYKIFA